MTGILQTTFVHELIFETEDQAHQAAWHLSNVQSVEITNATEDVQYFVDVPQAWSLRFRTNSELDKGMQDLLKRATGLIPEIPPDFNLDALAEDEIAGKDVTLLWEQ